MVYSMITGDMLTFGIIYMVVLFGFSQSFYFLYKGFPGVKSSLYHSYHSTWMALFQITLGDYSVSWLVLFFFVNYLAMLLIMYLLYSWYHLYGYCLVHFHLLLLSSETPFSPFPSFSLSFTSFPPEVPPLRMWPQPFSPMLYHICTRA